MEEKKKKKGIGRKVLLLICIALMLYSGFQIGKIFYGYAKDRGTYTEIEEQVKKENTIDFKALLNINSDIVGWISLKDSIVDYPLVQGGDNDYYLYRNVKGEYAGAGSIFMDYRSDKNFKDFVTIIYGHHMKDGSMFNVLDDYQEDGYYEGHKKWKIDTKKANYTLEIFAGYVVKSNDPMYNVEATRELNSSEREDLIKEIREKSDFATKVKVDGDDHIVALSTCYPKEDDDRYLLFGKLVKN